MNPLAEGSNNRLSRSRSTIVRFCRTLRSTWEGRELSDQLFRAGTRVGANYRSASRARSHADFVHKIAFVVEEADETVYWLELIRSRGSCHRHLLDSLLDESNQLSRIFNQSQLTAKNNAAAATNPMTRCVR